MRSLLPIVLSLAIGPMLAAQTRAATDSAPALRLYPLADGLLRDAPAGDRTRLGETTVAKEAAKVGLDLTRPDHPLLAARYADGRLFFVFYKVVEEAFGGRAWMLQRIEKIERTWAKPGAEPETKTTWQIEAFKTFAGSLKGPDQHFGSFGLRGAHRREIVKHYEIGFGELPGRADGAAWPFAANRLFEMIQPYGDERAAFDAVRFTSSRKWTLTVTFEADGDHSIRCDELGIDVPEKRLARDAGKPKLDPASKSIVLEPGRGPKGLQIGASTVEQVTRALGAPLEDVPAGAGHRNVSYRGGLTCNFDERGMLATVISRPSFGGRTHEGVAHGSARAEVRRKLGAPEGGGKDDATWTWPGLVVAFDAAGEVARLVVTAKDR